MYYPITVVSVGPGDPDLLTVSAVNHLQDSEMIILRTAEHPITDWLKARNMSYISLDDFYNRFEDFDEMHQQMVSFILDQAQIKPVVYAVPDPASDRTVSLLKSICRKNRINLFLIPGVSYSNAYLSSPSVEDTIEDIRISTAASLSDHAYDPEIPLLILEIDNQILSGNVKSYLNQYIDDECIVTFFPPGDSRIYGHKEIHLFELDRQKKYDHTAALFVSPSGYTDRQKNTFHDLELIMKKLRAPDGCPWDREQTHISLRQYLVEEAWEAVSTIDDKDMEHLADELGDVLFQIVFHASIAEDYSEFTMTDVITCICRKMIQRHPHVFGCEHFVNAGEVSAKWESFKRKETGSTTVAESMNDVAVSLPSLKYAIKVLKKAVQWNAFRRKPDDIVPEICSLSASLLNSDHTLNESKMGELLMKCTQLCQLCGTDSETLLHRTVDSFKKSFRKVENAIFLDGKSPESLTFEQLCVYLNYVKEEIE